jgi:hypothetical protein
VDFLQALPNPWCDAIVAFLGRPCANPGQT